MKKLNTAQSLLANIALKTKALPMFDGEVLVKQWKASEQIKYWPLLDVADEKDELATIKAYAKVVALSLVDDKGSPLFDFTWDDKTNEPVFSDAGVIEAMAENQAVETKEAFVKIANFNGVYFGDDAEETAKKN